MTDNRPLKRHRTGLEAEYMILDSKGRISDEADKLIKAAKVINPTKEASKNMIEIITQPHMETHDNLMELIDHTRHLHEAAQKNDLRLFAYGTYPGSFVPKMRSDRTYKVKERILGKERFKIAGRCVGVHCHYTLPKGIFDYFGKSIKMLINSKIKQNFVDAYNLSIAIDPAMSTFMQSSPLYQGKRYGKDARVMFYRGNDFFDVDGLYSNYPEYGALPPYKHTIFDIIYLIEDRFKEWEQLVRKLGTNLKALTLYGSILDTNWAPVKVNAHSTLEIRGMDTNNLKNIAASSALIKHLMSEVVENRITVKPSEIAIDEPFKVEDDVLHIPPFNYVNYVLQRDSAVYGLASPAISKYCSRLLKFANRTIPSEKKHFLKPFGDMVTKGETVSDQIIKMAEPYVDGRSISNKDAAELALKMSDSLEKDLAEAEKIVERAV